MWFTRYGCGVGLLFLLIRVFVRKGLGLRILRGLVVVLAEFAMLFGVSRCVLGVSRCRLVRAESARNRPVLTRVCLYFPVMCVEQGLKHRSLCGIVVALAYFVDFSVFVLPEGSQTTCFTRYGRGVGLIFLLFRAFVRKGLRLRI